MIDVRKEEGSSNGFDFSRCRNHDLRKCAQFDKNGSIKMFIC
jgi:hypothetical protein